MLTKREGRLDHQTGLDVKELRSAPNQDGRGAIERLLSEQDTLTSQIVARLERMSVAAEQDSLDDRNGVWRALNWGNGMHTV